MAKYSMKKGGKEVGPATTYAPPHTMTGGKVTAQTPDDTPKPEDLRLSVGNMGSKGYPPAKTSGIKIRGTGAATKGVMARGPV